MKGQYVSVILWYTTGLLFVHNIIRCCLSIVLLFRDISISSTCIEAAQCLCQNLLTRKSVLFVSVRVGVVCEQANLQNGKITTLLVNHVYI